MRELKKMMAIKKQPPALPKTSLGQAEENIDPITLKRIWMTFVNYQNEVNALMLKSGIYVDRNLKITGKNK